MGGWGKSLFRAGLDLLTLWALAFWGVGRKAWKSLGVKPYGEFDVYIALFY